MASLAQNGSQFGQQANRNQILEDCRDVDREINELKKSLVRLQKAQLKSLNDASNPEQMKAMLDGMSTEIMAMYRNLTGRVRMIKSEPESGSPKNAPQIGKVDRALKDLIKEYQLVDADYTRRIQDQMARQYRIVKPDASEAEVRQAVENPNSQSIFSQALLNSDRQGQSQSVRKAVENRHEEIRKIEKQMMELAELFQDMDVLVMQQEAAVVNIEMKGEEVIENLDKGNEEIGHAIVSAKNTRKWKWWCLGISVLIVVIIVVIVLIYKFVIQTPVTTTKTTAPAKRFVLSDSVPMEKLTAGHAVVPGVAWTPPAEKREATFSTDGRAVVPGLAWDGNGKLVTREGALGGKFRSFQA
jgi:syntaxin 1B/2/3